MPSLICVFSRHSVALVVATLDVHEDSHCQLRIECAHWRCGELTTVAAAAVPLLLVTMVTLTGGWMLK